MASSLARQAGGALHLVNVWQFNPPYAELQVTSHFSFLRGASSCEGLFAQAKAEPQLVQHLAQIHTILMLVSAGHGFALVPESSVRLNPQDVVFSLLEGCDPIVELHAAWREGNDNPALGVLINLLKQWRAPGIDGEETCHR
mgnify:CR=1 FL=1